MRPIFVLVSLLVSLSAGFSQALDYAAAPQEALGYAFGATDASVTDALKAANTPFRQDAARPGQTLSKVTIANQTLDQLDHVTVELSFTKGALFQVSASLAYSEGSFRGLLAVLNEKYGARRSVDGGYHYSWFFNQANHAPGNGNPDFAIVLANDPIDKKTITLSYVDNVRRSNPAGAAAPAPSAPAPAATPVPTLDPKKF